MRHGDFLSSAYLDIRKPYVTGLTSLPRFASVAEATKFRDGLIARGFDGIIMGARDIGAPDVVVVFDPKQVIEIAPTELRWAKRDANEKPGFGLSADQARAYLERKVGKQAIRRLIDSGKFRIVESTDAALPAAVKKALRDDGWIGGYTDGDTSWIIADNLNDTGAAFDGQTDDAYAIFLHEVGVHYGMRELLGDELFTKVTTWANEADPKGKLGQAVAAARAAVDPKTTAAHVEEETLAWLVTNRANHDLPLVKRIISKIQAFLVRLGFKGAVTADALVELARGAARRASGGRMNTGRFAARDITQTEAFKRWFGDSKVVDENGQPLVVYHGTDQKFSAFDQSLIGTGLDANIGGLGMSGSGFYFTPDKETAEGYGQITIAAYLAVKNPFVVPEYQATRKAVSVALGKDIALADVASELTKAGYDGIIKQDPWRPEYVAFRPEQIKSATGNRGTFDPGNPDIRFARRPDSAPPTPEQQKNQVLREADRKVSDLAKKFLKRQLFPGGLLPDAVFKEKITRDSKIEVVEFDTRNLIGQLESAIESTYGKHARKLDVTTMEGLSEALSGTADQSIPQTVRVRLEAMRQYLDSLSKHYLAALHDDIKALQAQLAAAGKDTDNDAVRAKIDLFQTIEGNIGRYVHRSYHAFDDPRWFANVPDDVLRDARRYLMDRHMDRGETLAEADRLAEVALHEILKTGTAYDSMEAFIRETKLGAKDLSVLKQRKDIAPEIRALLGEYKDPRLNFAKSATKMARLVFNHLFLKQVRQIGMGQFLFEGTDRPPAATKQIAADSSEAYAPLNGLWTYPHIEQAFRDALGKEQMANWYRVIVQLNGFVKFGKTVLSPTTAARNWQSAAFFAIANGHFDWRDMTKSLDGFKEYFTNQGSAKKLAYLRNLKKLGVVYDVPYAGEMMRLLDDTQMADWLRRGNVELTIRKGLQYAQNFYRYGDDFWKIIGFENEKRALIAHGYDATAAETEAAERIRNTYPTYSMVGRFVNSLRRFPLAGTFVSFPAEIIRTSYHMLRYTAKDWQSEQTRPMAYRRAAGLAIAAAFAYATQETLKAMLGIGDDEEEAVRDLAPPWQKNSNLAFVGRDEKGNLRYFDLSFLDPYNYWKRPITAILRDEPWQETFLEVSREVLTPFFGVDILAGVVFEVAANKKMDTGAPVFKDNDEPLSQLGDIVSHVWHGVQPGLTANLERAFKAYQGEVSPSGREFTPKDEALSWVGWRATTVNPRASLYYRSWEFKDDKSEASAILRGVLNDPNEVGDDDLKVALENTLRRREIAYTKMQRVVAAARAAGMTDQQIRATLRDSRVSNDDTRALVKGEIPRFEVSDQAQQGAAKKAGVLFNAETKQSIRERYRQVRKMAREAQ